MSARTRLRYGLFFALHVFGLMMHVEIANSDLVRDGFTVLAFGLSWRQRPICLFEWALTTLGGQRLWLEVWGGRHWERLPSRPVGQILP